MMGRAAGHLMGLLSFQVFPTFVIISSNFFSNPALVMSQCRVVDVCSGGEERSEPAHPYAQISIRVFAPNQSS
jgi:hypothetical protein